MLIKLANIQNKQVELLKSMVLDLEQFDRDRTKFEDQQREIRLNLKNNRVTTMNDRITAILVHLRGDIAKIYIQKKLNELDEEIDIQNWDEFI